MRKKTKKSSSPPSAAAPPDPRSGARLLAKSLDSVVVGILSFEVANAMSRAAHLHRSLSDPDLSLSPLPLVSSDPSFLLSLARAEHLDSLNRVASLASRLGRRHCPQRPPLSGFEHVYSDLLLSTPSSSSSFFLLSARDMDSLARRMERLVASTASLYAELELLADLEHSVKKLPGTDEARRAIDRKIRWQRHDVEHLRDSSLWNHKFDKVVLMLAQSVCTIHARIRSVFGEPTPDPADAKEGGFLPRLGLRLHCGANTGRLFLNCLGSAAADELEAETETVASSSGLSIFGGNKSSCFGPKSSLTMLAPPNTLGGSCLAMHYANVVIVIDKLLKYPHLVGDEARDDLYQMLPSSLRLALRKSLRSYVRNLAIYDASLAHDWKEAMERTLRWLVPMAHNMVRWQTERNFEQQQQVVMRENVLLLQTLYFADRGKTEDAMCELLVGLNYICRYEQQQNAFLDCTSSVDFEECMDWQQQMQLVDSSERL